MGRGAVVAVVNCQAGDRHRFAAADVGVGEGARRGAGDGHGVAGVVLAVAVAARAVGERGAAAQRCHCARVVDSVGTGQAAGRQRFGGDIGSRGLPVAQAVVAGQATVAAVRERVAIGGDSGRGAHVLAIEGARASGGHSF